MKTQPISFLSVFIAAIAVPVLVSAAGLSRNLLLNPTTIAKAKGVVVLAEGTAKSVPKAGMNADANGIFLNGYDPVAYFTVHKAIKGNPSIKSSFRGAIFHFASAADKVAFDQNPSRYYPQYGGFCVNHLRKGELVASDPTVFFVYKNKLYLCADAGGVKEFRSNMDDNIRRADEQWVTHFGFHGNPPLR
jgi:YHS domain-containing protein